MRSLREAGALDAGMEQGDILKFKNAKETSLLPVLNQCVHILLAINFPINSIIT